MDADGLNDLESTPDFQLALCDAEAQLGVKAAQRAVVTPRREVVLTKNPTIRTSQPCRLEHLNHTFHFWLPATGMSNSRSQPGGNAQTHKTRRTFDAVHS